jgi:hypothetical protein
MGKNVATTDLTRGYYRRQYAGFIRGKRINLLSLSAEAWFWRIHSAADDFGNLDGDPALVFSVTAGRRKGVTVDDVNNFIAEMVACELIRKYECDGEQFLHIIAFTEMQPSGKNGRRVRRFPESPWDYQDLKPDSEDVSGCIRVNPGESKEIQGNPEKPGPYYDYDYNYDHNQKECSEPASRTSLPHPPLRIVSDSPEPSQPPKPTAEGPQETPEALYPVFPTVGGRRSKDRSWTLTDALLTTFTNAFPGVDVPRECRAAHAWVVTNPTKRKTAGGMPDFLRRWLQKVQDRGGSSPFAKPGGPGSRNP